MALGAIALIAVLVIALAVSGRWRALLPNAVSTATAAATPLGGALTPQDDPGCGVRFLRPGEWVLLRASSDCASRFYAAPGSSTTKPDRLVLQAINYRVVAEQTPGGPGAIAQYWAFQRDSTLDGWSRQLERMWAGIYVTATLEYSTPDARVYALRPSTGNEIDLIGLKVDQGQPLALGLSAYGAYANMDRLRAEHIWDEYLDMVNSLAASGPTAPTGTPLAAPTVPAGSAHAACLSGVRPRLPLRAASGDDPRRLEALCAPAASPGPGSSRPTGTGRPGKRPVSGSASGAGRGVGHPLSRAKRRR